MKIYVAIISCFVCICMHAQDISEHRWNDRILIIKAKDLHSTQFQDQIKEFSNSAKAFIDRRLVLYTVQNSKYSFTNYQNYKVDNSGKVAGELLKILNSKEDFEIILIGLDGHIKHRQTNILTKKTLFDKIDSMPMRKNEIRQKQTKNE